MKEITIQIPDAKVEFFIELLDQLDIEVDKIQEGNKEDAGEAFVKDMLQRGYEVKTMKNVKNLTLNKETIDIILNS